MPEQEEPRPAAFRIIPQHSPVSGQLTGFTIEDPEGNLLAKREMIIEQIHKRYPGQVTLDELEHANIRYFKYRAVLTLGRVTFAIDSLMGKPAVRELTTGERLVKYGVPAELWEIVIDMDREYNLEQLREMCQERGLPTGGDKKKLAARIVMYEEGQHGTKAK